MRRKNMLQISACLACVTTMRAQMDLLVHTIDSEAMDKKAKAAGSLFSQLEGIINKSDGFSAVNDGTTKPAEEPAAEVPAAEVPAAEVPAAEEPAAEEPAAEEPAAEEPAN